MIEKEKQQSHQILDLKGGNPNTIRFKQKDDADCHSEIYQALADGSRTD
jgi:hypothetical protein